MEEVELRACIAGLYIGISLHNPVILETDCAFVVASLASGDYDRSAMRDLKMKALSISKLINNLQLSKISRSANKVAHLIAKYSFDNILDGILVNNVPPCVVNISSGSRIVLENSLGACSRLSTGQASNPTPFARPTRPRLLPYNSSLPVVPSFHISSLPVFAGYNSSTSPNPPPKSMASQISMVAAEYQVRAITGD